MVAITFGVREPEDVPLPVAPRNSPVPPVALSVAPFRAPLVASAKTLRAREPRKAPIRCLIWRTDIGRRGRADRATAASPTNGDPHQAHWPAREPTYPRAQRFGKQKEAHARERSRVHVFASTTVESPEKEKRGTAPPAGHGHPSLILVKPGTRARRAGSLTASTSSSPRGGRVSGRFR
jgi:hypothetical protein